MIRICIGWVAAALIGFSVPVHDSFAGVLQQGAPIAIAQNFSIHSDVLDEDRELLIYLPKSYDAEGSRDRRYPVLYLLDGPAYFNATVGIVYHLGDNGAAVERIPELIVVAIRNIRTAGKVTRNRDMTPSHMSSGLYSEHSGGAAAFRTFLSTELIPQVESRFRTQKQRLLVGHSLAGLFTLDTLIEQPQLFDAYIAIDPSASWDEDLLTRKLKAPMTGQPRSAVKIFMAEANTPARSKEEQAAFDANKQAIRSFRKALRQSRPSLQLTYRYFPDETHLSVPLVGIYQGLLSVYAGYQKP